jgi:uncharacterized membrane protein YfcA
VWRGFGAKARELEGRDLHMNHHQLLLPISGLVVGILIGLTGIGGGVLMTPLLLLLGLPPTAAVGTDLAYSALTKLAGTFQHGRQGTIEWKVVRTLAVASIPFTVVAVWILSILHKSGGAAVIEDRMKQLIGVMLIIAAVLMIRKVLGATTMSFDIDFSQMSNYPTARILAIGALGGFLVGLTSIGSGSLIIALLVMVISLTPAKLVGTDIAHAFLLVTAGAVAHQFFLHDVQLGVAGLLLIGSIPGVLIGSRLTTWVPRKPLQVGMAGLLVATAWGLLR